MTTTVTIEAHCNPEKTEVEINYSDNKKVMGTTHQTIIQDGESHEIHVCDEFSVTVRERTKL